MDPKVREHIVKYCEENKWDTDDEALVETLIEYGKHLYTKKVTSRRWWDEYLFVVDLNGMTIGYINGITTGDETAKEKGFEFDVSTIKEYEPYQAVHTLYRPKK